MLNPKYENGVCANALSQDLKMKEVWAESRHCAGGSPTYPLAHFVYNVPTIIIALNGTNGNELE